MKRNKRAGNFFYKLVIVDEGGDQTVYRVVALDQNAPKCLIKNGRRTRNVQYRETRYVHCTEVDFQHAAGYISTSYVVSGLETEKDVEHLKSYLQAVFDEERWTCWPSGDPPALERFCAVIRLSKLSIPN